MIRTRLEWFIWMIAVAVIGGGWIFVSRSPAPETRSINLVEAPIVGHPAPDFTLNTPGGETVALAAFREAGQPVVVNFWASWCGPCRVEMPYFQNVSLKYNNRVAVVGINQGENDIIITDFGEQFKLTYPLLYDPDNDVNQRYLVSNLPTTVFIDADGIVDEIVIGTMNQGVLEDRIERLLDTTD